MPTLNTHIASQTGSQEPDKIQSILLYCPQQLRTAFLSGYESNLCSANEVVLCHAKSIACNVQGLPAAVFPQHEYVYIPPSSMCQCLTADNTSKRHPLRILASCVAGNHMQH